MSEKPLELAINQIKNLLAEKKYKQAFEVYEHISIHYPFNKKVLKAKNDILKFVEKENTEKIESAMLKAKEYMELKDFENAIKLLGNFIKIAPNHKKLNKLLTKAKDFYKLQIKEKQKDFDDKEGKNFSVSMNKPTTEFLRDIINFKRTYQENPIANNFLEKAKIYYIQKKIEKSEELLKSKKFELIENFISDLKTISDTNMQIQELEKKIKKEKYDSQVQNMKESVFEAEKNIETLLKMKKFQKAYQASNELLRSDPKNQKALELLKESKIQLNKLTKDQTIDLINLNLETLKEEYSKEPQKFLKI